MVVDINIVLEQDFQSAQEYNDTTRSNLSEQEQFYADALVKDGFEVKFDDRKIYNRDTTSLQIVSISRSTLDQMSNPTTSHDSH